MALGCEVDVSTRLNARGWSISSCCRERNVVDTAHDVREADDWVADAHRCPGRLMYGTRAWASEFIMGYSC